GDMVIDACKTQAEIDAEFAGWLTGVTIDGGVNPVITTLPEVPVAPDPCGGEVIVYWTVTSEDGQEASTSGTFTILSPSAVNLTVPDNHTSEAFANQQAAETAFAGWLAEAGYTGGCDAE